MQEGQKIKQLRREMFMRIDIWMQTEATGIFDSIFNDVMDTLTPLTHIINTTPIQIFIQACGVQDLHFTAVRNASILI